MKKRFGVKAVVLTLAAASGLCWAQNTETAKPPAKFYQLVFVVRDLDAGKVVSARNYSMTVATDGRLSLIRAGSKVQVATSKTGGTEMLDLGTNIDCTDVRDLQTELAFYVTAEVTSIVQEQPETFPILRENKWTSSVVVPLKKSTVVFSSDDSSTKHVMQLEITATPR